MLAKIVQVTGRGVKSCLNLAGYELRRKGSGVFIDAADTIAKARREGVTVFQYAESLFGRPGDATLLLDCLAEHGAFDGLPGTIVEIGAGTGRVTNAMVSRFGPTRYEIYETAIDWASFLASSLPVIVHDADGFSLKQTASASVSLVHSYGVFVYLPFLVAVGYFREMFRVVRPGGRVSFNFISEDCMSPVEVDKWLASSSRYPVVLPRAFVLSLFEEHGFRVRGGFLRSYGEGTSEYVVFGKDDI